MKVLKHGKFFELGPIKCLHCDCLFTFSKHEVVSSFNREEGYDEHYVTCPECKSSVYLTEKELCDMLG